ncbi:transglycosylase SLT domain-containing protein [Congregibacter sp.]|uniref:transglycosylase SLT domain-containing protein n=1 Tax=Congregibacter sp. TaxID=2744308 RepID=UPI0038670C1C
MKLSLLKASTLDSMPGALLSFSLVLMLLGGCATSPPADVNNVCNIFDDKRGWYEDARDAEKAWKSSIPVMMAIVHQESRFVANAKPPRKKILGFIPGPRPSDSYGYSQALESTWEGYQRSAGRYGADRDDFGDAIDFVGWYNHQSYRRNGIQKNDAYRLYLAYHEGHGGYERATYRSKDWLLGVARKVSDRSASYERQLAGCRERLEKGRGWFDWF